MSNRELALEAHNIRAALHAASDLGLERELLEGVLAFAQFEENQGLYDEGEMLLHQAESAARSLADNGGLAAVLTRMGRIAKAIGDHDRADGCFRKAMELVDSQTDSRVFCEALEGRGVVAANRLDLDAAEEHLQLGHEIASKNQHWELICRMIQNLSSVAILRGELDVAEQYAQEGLELASDHGISDMILPLLSNLAAIEIRREGHAHLAETYLRKALAEAIRIGHLTRTIDMHAQLGAILSENHKYDESKDHLTESLVLARQVSNPESIIRALRNMGELEGKQGNNSVADSHFREAFDLAYQERLSLLLSTVIEDWCAFHKEQDTKSLARPALAEMTRVATEFGMNDLAKEAQLALDSLRL